MAQIQFVDQVEGITLVRLIVFLTIVMAGFFLFFIMSTHLPCYLLTYDYDIFYLIF